MQLAYAHILISFWISFPSSPFPLPPSFHLFPFEESSNEDLAPHDLYFILLFICDFGF